MLSLSCAANSPVQSYAYRSVASISHGTALVVTPSKFFLAAIILIYPFRNPTLEEQALARIHRIGQTQSVTTVRFYVRDSFEEVGEVFSAY